MASRQGAEALQKHWQSVATAHPGVKEIKVIGIDLTKRAETPLPKKLSGTRTAENKAVTKSTRAPENRLKDGALFYHPWRA